jgi:flagellar hook-associated protein 1 FlgK
VRQIRKDVNGTIVGAASDINRLTTEIAKLNVQIVSVEAGSAGISDAGGLRDQRSAALAALAKIIGIRTTEQESGSITVYSNGDYLVYDGSARPVNVVYSEDRGLVAAAIHIVDSDSPIETSSGSLTGLYAARDEVLGGFLDQLDDFTKKLIFEFNKVFSGGQGLTGYSSIESEHKVTDTDSPLDSAGLPFTPVNGTFQVLVQNKRTGLVSTTDIRVDLNGLGEDTSLEDLVDQLNAVDGLSAEINAQGGVRIAADSPVLEFSFANDTSGVLAALGVNTFFSGEGAIGIGVNATVRNDPSKFAASSSGIGADTENAVALAGLSTQPLESTGGLTLTEYYERFTADIFQASAVVQGINEGFETFRATLEGQQLGISGVNVDEQAIKMLQLQRAFQASARLVSTLNDLLDTLVNL